MAAKFTMGPKKPVLSGTWKTPVAVPKASPLAGAAQRPWGGAAKPGMGAQGAAAATGQAAVRGPAPLPVDPAYDQQRAALARQRDTTLGGLVQQRHQGLLQYGYGEDPTTGAVTFDATNPYSQAALLKRNYDNARTGNTNSMAARGQLYAGSLQNAQNETTRQQGIGEDQLQKQLLAFLARNTGAKAQTQTDFELGDAGAMASRLDRAPDSPLYDPVVDGGATSPVVAAAKAATAATARTAPKPPAVKAVGKAIVVRKKPTAKVKAKIPAMQVKPAKKGSYMGPKKKARR